VLGIAACLDQFANTIIGDLRVHSQEKNTQIWGPLLNNI